MIVLELLRFWHFVDFSVYEAEKKTENLETLRISVVPFN
jgi:hypothetical protein